MVSRNFHQDCLVDVKLPPTTICSVTQGTPTSSSTKVLFDDYEINEHGLSSLLRQKLEEHIGFSFQDLAILAISNQGITVHPATSKRQHSHSSRTFSNCLRSPLDSQIWSDIRLDQKCRVPNGILQELSDLQLSRDEDQRGTKIDTNMPSSFPKELSVGLGSDHPGAAQRNALDALKVPNSVSDPLTSTDVIVVNMFGFEISDRKELAKFYKDFLSRLAIRDLKSLVKLWVNHVYGREKQRHYTNGYKPTWWPKEVKFASINSLVKRELISLATSILCFRHDNPKKNIESLAHIAKEMRWEVTNKGKMFGEKVTAEVLRVARIHEDYDAGRTDGSTMVHVEALTRPKEIRGPRIKKRSRSAIEPNVKTLPLRDITTSQKLFNNVNFVERTGANSTCGKVTSPTSEMSSIKCKESTFETNAEEDFYAFNLEPESHVQGLDTEAVSERTPYQDKRRMLNHNGLQPPKLSSNSRTGTIPTQEASGFMFNIPPYPAQREEQCLIFDKGGFPGMTEAGCLTMPMDFGATMMAANNTAEALNIDFVNNNSSNNSSCSSCSSCSNASSHWVHGHETDMKPFHSNDGLTYPSEVGDGFSPILDELDCTFSERASFCDINHVSTKRRNNDIDLQPSILNISGHFLPLKHTNYVENDSYSVNDVIDVDFSSSLYSSKFPLSPEGTNLTSRQQQQQQQQIPFGTSGTAILQSNSDSNICSFGHDGDMNELIPLETF